ncbi:DUF4272 domain-containing protein [Paenibacillus melissococcoides]|uniref:DUF4272 domain-containing protein n=1 Tax=Paenibacillus melissococcoides TaxID=2912268 RepID=A0ABN8UEJ1_9BACL|nr:MULTISPECIES: DUF4272 domain-containing protein [Paenibacillus]MEB9895805.1 DUF4272 domain-containing protein [Bacillus cereus]CAH8249645.1 DUF4272 domain-containing protein [Paenibacillus melissococcoides]CAH8721453.1 DUF4272 domain-containing protein [Paenibacillus melissococcoides]CAH8721766.1 DUF4272 domain-containing protein [Paenibacillus melissococcoides]GIO80762.1 hypothetical protein J6TS7_43720 [Paenibacillus dendritiformis]
MKYFSIFASKNDIDDIGGKIADVFATGHKIEQAGNDYIIQSNSLFKKHKLTIRVLTEETNPDYFEATIPGMMGFYDRISFADEKRKELVLTQISVFNTLLAIQAEKELNEGQLQLCTVLMSAIDGIGFLQDGTLLDSDGQVIVYPDGTSGPADYAPRACTNKVIGQEMTSEEGERRKRASIAYIQGRGIPVLETLPQLPPAAACGWKSQKDIARRAVALLIVIQYACDVTQGGDLEESKEFVMRMLHKFDVEDQLTEKERKLLQEAEPVEQEAVNIVWQYEAYWPLIWALGLVDSLDFPDQICDCEYAIEAVSRCDSFEAFYGKTALRSREEIMNEADKIYRLHWACVDSRIHGKEAPAGMSESIVMERRRGLFWMVGCDEEDWDHIPMDT